MANLFQSSECSVCLEHYTDEQYPVGLACGHVFCCRCVQRVVERAASNAANGDSNCYCPIDRQRFVESDVRRIYNEAEEETPGEKLQNVAEFLAQLQQKNSELELRNQQLVNRENQLQQLVTAKISDLKAENQRLVQAHKRQLTEQAAQFEAENRNLVAHHAAQIHQQRMAHEQETKI